MKNPNPPSHIAELDGLRGLAILLVLAFHAFWFPFSLGVFKEAHEGTTFWLQKLALSGWVGVDLFFVLSGFLITRLLLHYKDQPQAYRRFFLRRSLRIFPPYFLLLLAWLGLRNLYPAALLLGDTGQAQATLWTYTSNWRLAWLGWESLPTPLAHAWTLSLEEQFYLVWPFVILGLERRQALRVCLAVMILCPLLRFGLTQAQWNLAAYVWTPARLDTLAWGGALALGPKISRAKLSVGLVSAALVLLGLFFWRQGWAGEDEVFVVFGLSALALFFTTVLALSLDSVRALRWTPLRILVKYSYGIYLYHQPALLLVLLYGYRDIWLYGLGALVLPFALAFASYHLWEKWFLRLKDRI